MIKTSYVKQRYAPSRQNFAKIGGTLSLPNLIEIQTASFDWFVKKGLDEVFKDIFPIDNGRGLSLEYVSSYFAEPTFTETDCKNRDMNYCRKLKAVLRLVNSQSNANSESSGEIKEAEVYMGEFPVMTDTGTFIINGAERVIVSQIVRSAGAYFSKNVDTKNGKLLYGGDLIPTRGTWLQFETDVKDMIIVRIDRTRKLNATVLLKALGLETKQDIEDLFGKNALIENTLDKDKSNTTKEALKEIHDKLRPGEPATEMGPTTLMFQRFFDKKRYDLSASGRYKLKQKLSVYNRLVDTYLIDDLIDNNGEVVYRKETHLTKAIVKELQDKKFFETSEEYTKQVKVNKNFGEYDKVNVIEVYADETKSRKVRIVGTDLNLENKHVTIPDIYACFSYLLNLMANIGDTDDIDHLGNRRIRCVGELLQNQFRIGLSRMERSVKERMSITETESMSPTNLINIKPLTASIKEFFSSSQLSQFMDQTNPIAELTNKRRISALGQGGITRERATFEVRDVHYSHYGRICPIETPEGPNIGLINYISCYAKINEYGFIETPYRKVLHKDGKNYVSDTDCSYLSADEEKDLIIGTASFKMGKDGEILDKNVISRFNGEDINALADKLDYVDVAPRQIISIPTGLIPFIENDDAARAMLGANMQRQAVPLLRPHAPYVGTGMEYSAAHDSGVALLCKEDGIVTYVDSTKVEVKNAEGETKSYALTKFARSNSGTCFNQNPIVLVGQEVKKGDILADGPSMDGGELALGQNVVIAFTTWHGYNYEDAVIISKRLVKDDTYTSIHIEEYELECRDTKLGAEEITRDIPNVGEESKRQLDELGIVVPGSVVKEGDILVGKITPRGVVEPSSEEKIIMAIFGDKTKEGKDSSLRVPHGGAGIVLDVKVFNRKTNGVDLPPGINQIVRVFIAQKRKISEGDKMAGRHGNKGVISKIVPEEDMPFLPDGTPVDVILNPLGVPSRMNIGQVLELHLGMACDKLGGMKIATNPFDGVTSDELMALMDKAHMASDGKYVLVDGQTGERFDEKISVGIMYFLKLSHMVDDKLHARSIGPYSLVTQQPLGGKAQNGGQRFGEMEVWALEAYGAAHTLQEILTIKSDDVIGRGKAYEAIIKNKEIPNPGIPESFRVLQKELQSLAIDINLYDENGELMDTSEIMKDTRQLKKETQERFGDQRAVIDDSFIEEEGE